MARDLGKDLEELDNFFNLNYRTDHGFARSIEFTTYSNSYVRILKEAIDKINFGLFDSDTRIDEIVNTDSDNPKEYRKYVLRVDFDMNY